MSAGPARIASFRGRVSCRHESGAPGLTLAGTSDEGEAVSLSFSGPAGLPAELPALPATLEDVVVERVEDTLYRVRASSGEWLIPAGAAHLHREVAQAFYAVIRPRTPPWHKRALWRLLLAMAGSPVGSRVIRWLRR